MHIKSLQKANSLLEKLRALDIEIISIGKYANTIQAAHLNIFLNMSHNKQVYEEPEEATEPTFYFPVLGGGLKRPQAFPKKETFALEITEVSGLQVLGVLIAHKESERMAIIRQLTEMGFEISL